MGRVCSMESKASLPILVRRAGTRVARLPNFAALGKGKTRGTFGKKAPGLHRYMYLLKESPGASPVLSSDPQKNQQQEHCSINIKISQQYRVPLPIWAYNNHKKVPQQPQPETSFCPTNLPRNMSFSNAYLIFDKLITRRTHTSNLPSSSTRTVHVVPPNSLKRHSRISSASVLPLRYAMWDVGYLSSSSSSSSSSQTSRKKEDSRPTQAANQEGNFYQSEEDQSATRQEESEQHHQPINSPSPTLPYLPYVGPTYLPVGTCTIHNSQSACLQFFFESQN